MPNLTDTELAELKKDKARLDWFERHLERTGEGVEIYLPNPPAVYSEDTPRQAIDAAMEAEKGEDNESFTK